MTPDKRLAQLNAELDRGQIYEGTIHSDGEHVMGLCESGLGPITIDPTAAVVELLLHELLHRRYWQWSETRVQREAARLLHNMTPAEVRTWYRKYRRVVRKRRPVNAQEE